MTGSRLEYQGRTGTLFGIMVVNFLLMLLTLGIYRFWAVARTRRYLWSVWRIDGEPLDYTGTGWEMFIGFVKVAVILVVISLVAQLAGLVNEILGIVLQLVFVLALGLLAVAGAYLALRYRLSRTWWHGIRFGLDGKALDFVGVMVGGFLLTVLTLGLYRPFWQTSQTAYVMRHTRFGVSPFIFTATGGPLFWPHVLALVLAPLTIGISLLFYRARVLRHFTAGTRFEGVAFSFNADGWEVTGLVIGNWLLLAFSLGILYPVVVQRQMRFWERHLVLDGAVDLAAVRQGIERSAGGEGLAGYLGDLDAGLSV